MAFLIMFTLKEEAPWIYERMMDDLPLLLLSVGFFIIVGFAILFPGFIYFWSLFMNDKR